MTPEETVSCLWCGKPTTYTGTRHCDPCHELDKRISANPELAARIAGYYGYRQNITYINLTDNVQFGIGMAITDSKQKGKKKHD